MIRVLGGSYHGSVQRSTTHVVVTDFTTQSIGTTTTPVKIRKARERGLQIVRFKWLEESLNNMTRMPEDDYRLRTQILLRNEPAPEAPAGDQDAAQPPPNRPRSESQIAKSFNIKVPVDKRAAERHPGLEVYIDENRVIHDASLSKVDIAKNQNTFYRIQLLRSVFGEFFLWTRGGRVGSNNYEKLRPYNNNEINAVIDFKERFYWKTALSWDLRDCPPRKNKFIFIKGIYEEESGDNEAGDPAGTNNGPQIEPNSTLSEPVQELMKLIFNRQYFAATMEDLNYDDKKLPLGKLRGATITRAFQALRDLEAVFLNPSLARSEYQTTFEEVVEEFSNLYYTLIPHEAPRKQSLPAIQSLPMIQREMELLQNLKAMKDAEDLANGEQDRTVNKLDQQFQSLGIREMTPLNADSQEFIELKNLMMSSRAPDHPGNFQVSQIFRIRLGKQHDLDATYGPPGGRRFLLWHGSRCTNFAGILSQGLRIAPPEAPMSGYMFGRGIYLADISSKSAIYCYPKTSNGHALILLCEAEIGRCGGPFISPCYTAGQAIKAAGGLSAAAKGRLGMHRWKDAECIHPSLRGIGMADGSQGPSDTGVPYTTLRHNEYICYDERQVRPRYLFQIRI
ncbi:hypothetical protein AAE478_002486 [Parahypoxylon ruwenzoriense]